MNRAVFKLASMAKNSGASGVICSAKEASEVREYLGEDFIIVTPGIRMQNNTVDDQARVATPKYAVAQGASKLVIGRSITVDNDPYKKYMSIKKEI
jgi:orotidine-5'-phosphate decarboxylase